MSTQQDISNEMRSETEGAACRTESENHPAHDRACDYADLVHHHNERAKARQKQPEPTAEQVPDNHEPVKAEGTDMFHSQGISFCVSFRKAQISALANFFIWDDLRKEYRERMGNLITDIEPAIPWLIEEEEKESEAALRTYDANEARRKRMEALAKHGKKIGVNIPYDPFFME